MRHTAPVMTPTKTICIPIEFKAQGGGFYFLRAFEEYLQHNGWQVVKDLRGQYAFLFTNHWQVHPRQIAQAIRHNPGVCVVQRIDGAAQDYGRDPEADRLQAAVNRLADLTIFQSQYCRYSTRQKFPVIGQDGPVVYNPVDLGTFNPQGERRALAPGAKVAAISWSTNPRKGAASLYAVAQQNPEVHLYLCGNYPDAPALPNLHELGVLGREALASTLRACDALLTFSENEACPNHVLEALACGLPVLYVDSGAMKEVVGECGLPVTVDSFAAQFARLQSDPARLSAQARARAEQHFNPAHIFPVYVEHMQHAQAQPRHRLARSLRAWAALLRGR